MDNHWEIAAIIRETLLEAYPDNPTLKNQCKRAAVYFDQIARQLKINSYPVSGWIHHEGHVWTLIKINGNGLWILDPTLSQFSSIIGKHVPDVVLEKQTEASKRWGYCQDRFGVWEYHVEDYRKDLLGTIKKKLKIK